MRAWSEQLAKHAKLIFIILIIITCALSFGIKKLVLDTDMQNLLGISQKSLFSSQLPAVGNDLRNTDVIVYDAHLFTPKKLLELNAFQEKLSNIPSVDKVTSLFSMPNLQRYFEEKQMVAVLNIDVIKNTPIETLKHSALSNHSYIHSVINPEATALAFIVHIKESVPTNQLLSVRNAIEQLINQYHSDFQDLFQMGELENNFYSARDATHDIAITGSLTLLILIIAFSFFFRSPFLGLAPFLTAGLAMIWTLGIMGYCHIHFNVMTSLAVIMTYTVGTMENAHFINAYQKSHAKNPEGSVSQHSLTHCCCAWLRQHCLLFLRKKTRLLRIFCLFAISYFLFIKKQRISPGYLV